MDKKKNMKKKRKIQKKKRQWQLKKMKKRSGAKLEKCEKWWNFFFKKNMFQQFQFPLRNSLRFSSRHLFAIGVERTKDQHANNSPSLTEEEKTKAHPHLNTLVVVLIILTTTGGVTSRARAAPTRAFGATVSPHVSLNQETDYHLIQLHLPLPQGANQSARTPWAFPPRRRELDTLTTIQTQNKRNPATQRNHNRLCERTPLSQSNRVILQRSGTRLHP